MKMIHWAPPIATAIGVLGIVLGVFSGLPVIAAVLGVGYLAVSNALLALALGRSGAERFGQANAVTTVRSVLVGFVTVVVAASFLQSVPAGLLLALAIPALALDAVDGWVARRTGSATPLGARFDMEVDAFLLLMLSVFVAQTLGTWVLAIGIMRYAFVVAGWALPWLRAPLPPRHWRKVVTAVQGVALIVAASGLVPTAMSIAAVAVALLLLCESFGRDVVWLVCQRGKSACPKASNPGG
ncbi:CDP-alcohol phosphatidyltransferase family protein [Microbacterium halotolerans]|uniref:CDP-alcohol phosphatidyltransferase family protein n=1 Tax=Microbacterium halotolerans TaxID=246613 RepID=UPI0019698D72|nr:CDP-alcohol phosphatidyltransferase family protein [Microbacterium halotolerans]